jgi:hypothetical protein
MTAAQKTAKANFKKAIEYRKKTGVSLKEAFAHVYGKKKVGAAPKKKAAKKKAAPKKAAKKKVGAAPKKKIYGTKKRKPISEQSILNKIHKVKDEVNKLDEAQHKHMVSGLKKIVGIPHKAKYYITYTTDNGIKKVEYFDKLPVGRYKGMDRVIYLTRLTKGGTSLIPVKLTRTDKELKK